MITTKEIKIKIPSKLTSRYIEEELIKKGLNVIHWAITDFDDKYYTLSIAVKE